MASHAEILREHASGAPGKKSPVNPIPFSYEALQEKLKRCTTEERRKELQEEYTRKEHDFLRFKRTPLKYDDFTTLQIIGKGAFGMVRLVQKKDTGKLFALKSLRKSTMIKNDQVRAFYLAGACQGRARSVGGVRVALGGATACLLSG